MTVIETYNIQLRFIVVVQPGNGVAYMYIENSFWACSKREIALVCAWNYTPVWKSSPTTAVSIQYFLQREFSSVVDVWALCIKMDGNLTSLRITWIASFWSHRVLFQSSKLFNFFFSYLSFNDWRSTLNLQFLAYPLFCIKTRVKFRKKIYFCKREFRLSLWWRIRRNFQIYCYFLFVTGWCCWNGYYFFFSFLGSK